MRTLPHTGRSPRGPRVAPRRRRAAAIVVGLSLAGAGLAAIPSDPLSVSRWLYRATLRARGGSFEPNPGALLQSGPSDCGPAALATLFVALGGDPPDTRRIGRLAGTGANGTTFAGLSRAARLLGMPNRLVRLDPASLVDLSSPVIAWVDRGHFVTLVPDPPSTVLVLDPLVGSYRIEVVRLRRFWAGEALLPEPARRTREAPTSLTGSGGIT